MTTGPCGRTQSRNTGRKRDETRTVTVFDATDKFVGTDWHNQVAAIIRVEHDVFVRNSKTGLLRHASEIAFYISNKLPDAPRAAGAIRAHWGIESVPQGHTERSSL